METERKEGMETNMGNALLGIFQAEKAPVSCAQWQGRKLRCLTYVYSAPCTQTRCWRREREGEGKELGKVEGWREKGEKDGGGERKQRGGGERKGE